MEHGFFSGEADFKFPGFLFQLSILLNLFLPLPPPPLFIYLFFLGKEWGCS